MFFGCECRVLSDRGLCDELITRPEESYRLCCVVVCDLETTRTRMPWPALGPSGWVGMIKSYFFFICTGRAQYTVKLALLVAGQWNGARKLYTSKATPSYHWTLGPLQWTSQLEISNEVPNFLPTSSIQTMVWKFSRSNPSCGTSIEVEFGDVVYFIGMKWLSVGIWAEKNF